MTGPERTAGAVSLREEVRDPRWWDRMHPAEAGEVDCALDALPGADRALRAGLLEPRWNGARVALAGGAPFDDVAQVLGITSEDLAAGLRSWADRLDGEASHLRALAGCAR